MSRRVLVLVEGQTERGILQRSIAPVLGEMGIHLAARVIGKPGRKGGAKRGFDSILRELRSLAKQEGSSLITTFFDYNGMPESWPGVADSKGKSAEEIPATIEAAMADLVASDWGSALRPTRFIPYVQMFEIEALFFAGPQEMADVFERPEIAGQFQKIVTQCGGCERINDTPIGCPSNRIARIHTGYNKGDGRRAQAPIIVRRIGLDRIRSECPHFNDWLTRLENAATSTPN